MPEKFWDPEKGAIKTDDVLKSYTELEKAIGKPKYGVPPTDAPPEQQAEFYKALGVPETPEAYGLKPPEGFPEHMGEYMTDTLNEYVKVAHDLKLTPKQAEGLQKWYDNMAMQLGEAGQKAQTAEAQASQAKLTEHFTKLFGNQTGEAVARVKQSMTEAIPDAGLREALSKTLPDEALVAIAAIEQHYRKTYGKADENIGKDGQSSAKSLEDLRVEAKQLMASDAYRDPMHKDHKATREKAEQMYKDIGALTDAARKR